MDHSVFDRTRAEVAAAFLRGAPWIRRVVETIAFVDANCFSRNVTLDIRLGASGVQWSRVGNRVEVPIAVISKRLLAHFDLRGSDDGALPVLGRDADSGYMWSLLVNEGASALGVLVTDLNQEVMDRFWKIVWDFPATTDNPYEGRPASWELSATDCAEWCEEALSAWQRLTEHETFSQLLLQFTFSFLLITELKEIDETQIVKYRWQDGLGATNVVVTEKLGLIAPFWRIEVPGVAAGRSYHCQLLPPSEMVVTDIYLARLEKETSNATEVGNYERQLYADFAQVHTSGDHPAGVYQLIVAMRVSASGMYRSVVFSSWITTLAVVAAFAFHRRIATIERSSSEAAVALLLVAPSLVTAYLVRPEEHEMVSDILLPLRVMAGAIALGASSVAAGVAFRLSPVHFAELSRTVMETSISCMIITTLGYRLSIKSIARSRKLMGRTRAASVAIIPFEEPAPRSVMDYEAMFAPTVSPHSP